jgi:8-oxo-dGTP pyrophosphatase MutT (NUDIX family)
MLTFHAIGDWAPGAVHARWIASTRLVVPEVERQIETAWLTASSRPGVQLFDGPMCRLESWRATPDRLELVLSRTSYKPFLGTNLMHPELADRFGRQVLANPVGVSPAMVTADGFLIMGRRNASVAYYPNRVHPFAGALDERDGSDVFGAVRRELAEELAFDAADLALVRCTGIAEDESIRQPELIFRVTSSRTRSQIESQVDSKEHHASWAIRAMRDAVEEALARQPAARGQDALTPVGVAALLLWGRIEFGDEWFARQRH